MTSDSSTLRRAVFLDRDGVINVDHGYVYRWQDFEFLPGVPEALSDLNQAGFLLVVISNQSGIGRGLYTEADVLNLNRDIESHLAATGVAIDGWYHCPHHPTEAQGNYRQSCDCRKPAPGMILRACRDLAIDPAQSALVGDKRSDIEAGDAAGVGRLFWVTPAEHSDLAQSVTSLAEAAAEILTACT